MEKGVEQAKKQMEVAYNYTKCTWHVGPSNGISKNYGNQRIPRQSQNFEGDERDRGDARDEGGERDENGSEQFLEKCTTLQSEG